MKKLILATAALALSVGAASAASLKAKVPFEFQAAGKSMPAGAYILTKVNLAGDFGIWELYSLESKARVYVTAPVQMLPQTAAEFQSRLVFRCAEQTCDLAEIWRGGDVPAYKVEPGKLFKEQAGGAKLAVVRME